MWTAKNSKFKGIWKDLFCFGLFLNILNAISNRLTWEIMRILCMRKKIMKNVSEEENIFWFLKSSRTQNPIFVPLFVFLLWMKMYTRRKKIFKVTLNDFHWCRTYAFMIFAQSEHLNFYSNYFRCYITPMRIG